MQLHLEFIAAERLWRRQQSEDRSLRGAASESQLKRLSRLSNSHLPRIDAARAANATANSEKDKYRIAVLGRTRKALAPIAAALREARIPFRAVDLES